jgi:hypothetical protein
MDDDNTNGTEFDELVSEVLGLLRQKPRPVNGDAEMLARELREADRDLLRERAVRLVRRPASRRTGDAEEPPDENPVAPDYISVEKTKARQRAAQKARYGDRMSRERWR